MIRESYEDYIGDEKRESLARSRVQFFNLFFFCSEYGLIFEDGEYFIACDEELALDEENTFLIVEKIPMRDITVMLFRIFSETVCANNSHVIDNKLHLSKSMH